MSDQVFALDVGKSLGWWTDDAKEDEPKQRHLGELVADLRGALNDGPVSLGLECPLFIPVVRGRSDQSAVEAEDNAVLKRALEPARDVNEIQLEDRGWHYGGGATSFAAGFVQLCWLLSNLDYRQLSTDPARIRELEVGDLFIWEAFVTKPAKSDSESVGAHVHDARTAVEAYKLWEAGSVRAGAAEHNHSSFPISFCAGSGWEVCVSNGGIAPAVNMVEVALDQLDPIPGSRSRDPLSGHLIIRPLAEWKEL